VATIAVAFMSVTAVPASAQFGEGNSANNLFSQYYTQPGASTTQAGMYMAPHYVPANVGHSYYTYQPLMPHEMMHQHTRNYYNYYNTGGYYGGYNALNKTQVRWQSGSNHMGPMPFSGGITSGLKWRYNKRKYCLDGDCSSTRSFGGFGGGCASGNCGGGEVYGGEVYSGGCASGSCAANATADQTIKR
jgi:hypothetical protein